jgi:hypothetical protein
MTAVVLQDGSMTWRCNGCGQWEEREEAATYPELRWPGEA